MKVNLFALCITMCTTSFLFATNGSGQDLENTQVVLSLNHAPLYEALAQIEQQSDFRFTYKQEEISAYSNLKIKKARRSVKATLELILKDTRIAYEQVGNYIVLREKPQLADNLLYPSLFTISGRVTDDSGEPLPGVNVVVKETTMGTVTDGNGTYTINTPDENGVLVFSFIGYSRKEVPMNGRSVIDITLEVDVQSLEEIVVVGYGTQKKSDLTGAVASISEKELQSRPMASFQDALQGRSSGVQIRQTGGDLSGRFSVNIRGIGSVTGSNDPLIVVDGVPLFSGGFSTINPKDIVSVDILKDASATAIYGARASNGVVIITTKRGKAGETQFTFSTDLGFEQIAKTYDVMNTEQQRRLFVEAFKNAGRNPSAYEDVNDPVWKIDTDWQDLATRVAFRKNYNMGVSGGTEKNRFAISASYLDREGTMKNSDLKSYFFRANSDAVIKNRLKISTNLSGSHQAQNVLSNDSFHGGAYRGLISTHTYIVPYDDQGNLTAVNSSADPYFGAVSNPLVDLLLPTREAKMTRLLGNIKADLEIIDGLTLSGNIGADYVLTNNHSYFPVYRTGIFGRDQGSVTSSAGQDINWVADATLQYEKNVEKHAFKVLGGLSAQQFNTKFSSVTGTGTIDNALNQLSNQIDFSGDGRDVSAGLASSFMRLNYGYADKYLLTSTVRRDGSSKFGPDKRYGIFPSASVAWRISEEQFLQSSSLLDDLKLRVSYGVTGNQNIGNFAFITRAGAAPYVFGNSVVVGNAPENIGNPDLQWESAKQFDIGMDASIWEGRLSFNVDYYNKKSEDLLIRTPIPFTAGVSENPTVNLGSVINKGLEFSATSRNLVGSLSWTTDFNITYNKNTVLNIGANSIGDPLKIPGQNIPLGNEPANMTEAGNAIGAFYMYKFIGIWQLGQEQEAAAWSAAVPGDPRYADLNNNGLLDEGDKSFVGIPQAKFFGGMNNTLAYQNFSLSVFLNFSTGNKLYNSMRNLNARAVPFNQQLAEVANFWTPENPTNEVPRPSQGGNTTFLATRVSTRFLESADFLRVKNVSLSYDIPFKATERLAINAARITLSGTNLFTFTEYKGLDPESSSVGSLLSAGIDHTPYPLSKFYSLSIQMTF